MARGLKKHLKRLNTRFDKLFGPFVLPSPTTGTVPSESLNNGLLIDQNEIKPEDAKDAA